MSLAEVAAVMEQAAFEAEGGIGLHWWGKSPQEHQCILAEERDHRTASLGSPDGGAWPLEGEVVVARRSDHIGGNNAENEGAVAGAAGTEVVDCQQTALACARVRSVREPYLSTAKHSRRLIGQ